MKIKKLLIFQPAINTPYFSIVKIFSAFLKDFIGSGYIWGSGRNLYAQILREEDSFAETGKKEYDCIKFWRKYQLREEKIVQIATGFHHSVMLTDKNQIYCNGLNSHGQCGMSNLSKDDHIVNFFNKVFLDLQSGEKITMIACGKSHTLFSTNQNRLFFFGATNHGQFGKPSPYNLDICSPREINLNLSPNEKIVKIKGGFDRSYVITNEGNCYIWGGEDLTKFGGEFYNGIVCLNKDLGLNYKIKDVCLGYLHTLVHTEE